MPREPRVPLSPPPAWPLGARRHLDGCAPSFKGSARLRVRRRGCLPRLPLARPRFFRTPRPAPAHCASLVCCVRSGGARPSPLRGPSPRSAAPSWARPSALRPQLHSCRPCARLCAPWSAVPPLPLAPFFGRLRASCGRPCGPPPGSSVLRGVRCFLSGRPLSRLRGRLPPPRAAGGLAAAFFAAFAARGLLRACTPACWALPPPCVRCFRPAAVSGVLPCAPPVPAAPAGGSGERRAQMGGLRPPPPFRRRLPRGCPPLAWLLRNISILVPYFVLSICPPKATAVPSVRLRI